MSMLFLTLSLLNSSYDYNVSWQNTYLTLELNEHVTYFEDLPEAYLYLNGTLINDPEMYYEKGVDRTSLSVITTNHVKQYHVNYRAVFPTYGIKSTTTIIFDVVDKVPPVVTNIPVLKYPLGTKTMDLTEGLEYKDNYDSKEKITVTVLGKEAVKSAIVGIYPIKYQISDASGNILSVENDVFIYDDICPVITQKKDLIINYGSYFTYSNFLEVKDNYDLVLGILVDDSGIDYMRLGIYPVIITVTDKSDNQTVESFSVEIRDTESPKISLISNIPKIEVFDYSALENIHSYILNVSDNHDDLKAEDAIIYHEINVDLLGTYDLLFSITDSSDNITEVKFKVIVVDQMRPVIELLSDLVLEVFSEEPNYYFYFLFQDNYSVSEDIKVIFTEKVNMSKTGRYELTVSATDEQKNKTDKLFFVYVVDTEAPKVIQDKDIIITNFAKTDYNNYFTVTDNYSKNFTFNTGDSHVDYEKTGIYEIVLVFFDEAMNASEIITEVIICDIIYPTLILTNERIAVEVYSGGIYLPGMVKEIYDNYDVLSLSDCIITGEADYSIVGEYLITFEISDSSLNYVKKELKVLVDDYESPVITVTLPKETDKPLNLLDYVTVRDNYDKDISVKVIPENIDTNNPGIYVITYYCQDSRGNHSSVSTEIKVLSNDNTYTISAAVPYIITGIIASGIVVFIYFKRRKN